jgi:hypothetical protein
MTEVYHTSGDSKTLSSQSKQTQKPNVIISADEVKRLKVVEDIKKADEHLQWSKQKMESFDEEPLMWQLKTCIEDKESYTGYSPWYQLYPPTITRLEAAGYTVRCSPPKPNEFGQKCAIYWGKLKLPWFNMCKRY